MGLIERMRRRRHVWGWRLRYWWMDTPGGTQAQVVVFCMAVLVVILQLIKISIVALLPPPPGEPVKAVYWWVVQIIVMVVAAVIAYALRPKPENAKPQEGQGQTTEDGQSVVRIWGTHWISDQFLLAWRIVGRDPIRAEGGK